MAGSGAGLSSYLKRLPIWWHNRLAAMRALDELNRSPHVELSRTAQDVGVTVQRLRMVTARGPVGARLLERMARSHGIGADTLRRVDRNTIREMEERCTFCHGRYRCAVDLASGEEVPRSRAYCPNAGAFEALREEAQHAAGS
jgi:hypothetical protein